MRVNDFEELTNGAAGVEIPSAARVAELAAGPAGSMVEESQRPRAAVGSRPVEGATGGAGGRTGPGVSSSRDRILPADTSIGDALAVDQRLARHEVLLPFLQGAIRPLP